MNAAELQILGTAAWGRGWVSKLAQHLGVNRYLVHNWSVHGCPDWHIPRVLAACKAQAVENKKQIMRLSRHVSRELKARQEARAAARAPKRKGLYAQRQAELERYLRWFKYAQAANAGFKARALRNGKPLPDWLKGVYVSD